MTRYYEPISKAGLKNLVFKKLHDIGRDCLSSAIKRCVPQGDIKVAFDFENFSSSGDFGPKTLGGFRSIGDFTFLGLAAGGDWEHPVFFIIYWDGKKLRAYVPMEGNPWNTDTKEAYGNDPEADLKNAARRYPDVAWAEEPDPGDFDFDWKLIREDILGRIVAKPRVKNS